MVVEDILVAILNRQVGVREEHVTAGDPGDAAVACQVAGFRAAV